MAPKSLSLQLPSLSIWDIWIWGALALETHSFIKIRARPLPKRKHVGDMDESFTKKEIHKESTRKNGSMHPRAN